MVRRWPILLKVSEATIFFTLEIFTESSFDFKQNMEIWRPFSPEAIALVHFECENVDNTISATKRSIASNNVGN